MFVNPSEQPSERSDLHHKAATAFSAKLEALVNETLADPPAGLTYADIVGCLELAKLDVYGIIAQQQAERQRSNSVTFRESVSRIFRDTIGRSFGGSTPDVSSVDPRVTRQTQIPPGPPVPESDNGISEDEAWRGPV